MGKVEGKRVRGRQRLTCMVGLTSVVVGDLKAKVASRWLGQKEA